MFPTNTYLWRYRNREHRNQFYDTRHWLGYTKFTTPHGDYVTYIQSRLESSHSSCNTNEWCILTEIKKAWSVVNVDLNKAEMSLAKTTISAQRCDELRERRRGETMRNICNRQTIHIRVTLCACALAVIVECACVMLTRQRAIYTVNKNLMPKTSIKVTSVHIRSDRKKPQQILFKALF